MSFIPYLHFRGDCAEAMSFYAEVFNAGPPTLMRYADAPPGTVPATSQRIMHSQIDLPDGPLMASDFPDGTEGDRQTAVSVMHVPKDADAAQRVFDRLADGGDVGVPLGPTFFSPAFGMVKDRFGTHWMVAAWGGSEP